MSLDLSSIELALERLSPYIHRTPLIHSRSFSELLGAEVYLKAENLQKTGSFKVRGAFNRLMGLKGGRVIAASMGNHAQGVAFAAASLGMKATIVMPVTASIVKQEATRGYGAEVVLQGGAFDEALRYALSQEGSVFIHAFDDEEVMAGQGTIGLELLDELKEVDAVLVPVGGGGLIAGISTVVKALSPKTEVIGVQTSSAPSAVESFHHQAPLFVTPGPTIADGIAVGQVGGLTLEVINRFVDGMVTVSEDSIAGAILLFLERTKMVVEGAGAVGLAALMEHGERFRGKRVALIVSGGNIDFTLIDRIIHRGLVSSGRISLFRVLVDDVPGSLYRVTGLIAEKRGNVLHVDHDRLDDAIPLGKTMVTFTVEVRGPAHREEIIRAIRDAGFSTGDA